MPRIHNSSKGPDGGNNNKIQKPVAILSSGETVELIPIHHHPRQGFGRRTRHQHSRRHHRQQRERKRDNHHEPDTTNNADVDTKTCTSKAMMMKQKSLQLRRQSSRFSISSHSCSLGEKGGGGKPFDSFSIDNDNTSNNDLQQQRSISSVSLPTDSTTSTHASSCTTSSLGSLSWSTIDDNAQLGDRISNNSDSNNVTQHLSTALKLHQMARRRRRRKWFQRRRQRTIDEKDSNNKDNDQNSNNNRSTKKEVNSTSGIVDTLVIPDAFSDMWVSAVECFCIFPTTTTTTTDQKTTTHRGFRFRSRNRDKDPPTGIKTKDFLPEFPFRHAVADLLLNNEENNGGPKLRHQQ